MLISSKKSYECAELKHVKQYPGCPGHSEQKEITLRTFLSISLYPKPEDFRIWRHPLQGFLRFLPGPSGLQKLWVLLLGVFGFSGGWIREYASCRLNSVTLSFVLAHMLYIINELTTAVPRISSNITFLKNKKCEFQKNTLENSSHLYHFMLLRSTL